MSQKWNLQDIRPANQARPKKKRPVTQTNDLPNKVTRRPNNPTHATQPPTERIVIEDGRKKGSKRIIFSVIFFFILTGGAVFLSGAFGKTQLTIYPEFRDPNISAEFTATATADTDGLNYEIMTLQETDESQVQASGKIDIEEQATGVIEISKSTPGAERLIAQTRFRSPDGLIFRIQESVVVPGAVTNDAGETVPGTIQAPVFADDIGQAYNLAANTTFDIPGFEENGFTELFNAISATNPQAFSGGFSGPQFQIDDTELSTARQTLQVDLRNKLLARVEEEKPAGMVAFPGSIAITYEQLPAIEYGSDLVTIKEQATLQIPLFTSEEFGSFLAQEAVATYEGGPVRVEDPSELIFSYTSATTSNSVLTSFDNLSFTLTGKPRLIWEYDAEKLTNDLQGLHKNALENAIKAYPGIVGARADITPFWQQHFPENPDDIMVIEELKEIE